MATAKKVATKPKTTKKIVAKKTVAKAPSDDGVAKPAVAKIEPIHVVRRKELVERIAEKTGKKPNLIKSVLDAVLLELGDALSSGESIRVQPLGKLSVNRRKELPDGEVIVCKLRRKNQTPEPETTVPVATGPVTTAAE